MNVRIVVGAAIVRDGRLLAARRSAPSHHAGGWEFPGGKVEHGETETEALVRECREELGVDVVAGTLVGEQPIAPELLLRVYRAVLVEGEPQPLLDHDDLRWLAADEIDDVPWLPADVPLVAALRAQLGRA